MRIIRLFRSDFIKAIYMIALHIINLFFLTALIIVSVSFLSNPSSGAASPFNPVIIGVLTFLLLFLITGYYFQLRKGKWVVLLIGSILYIAVFLIVLLLILPYFYNSFDFN